MARGDNFKGKPGPGRPKGLPNKATQDAREFAQKFIDDQDYRESLRRRVISGRAPHMEQLIWTYRYGKPRETLDVNLAELAPLRIVIEDASGD
jgi:hypothetical protein